MKTEKDEAVATFSLRGKFGTEGAGCSEPAVPGAPMPVAGSGGTPAPELRPLKRRPVPGKHYQCSSYGCKLAFPSMQELMDHLKVHYRPTQSLEGKTFQCPTLGCSETFPSMQDLMGHMKVHYKPNRYFKCENCLLRFRTHRSLFKHLHVCSDSASGPAPPPRPVLPPATSSPHKEPPAKPPRGAAQAAERAATPGEGSAGGGRGLSPGGAARLAGAAAPGDPAPLPAAGARPVRALVLDSLLGASPVLGAGAVPVLRAPLALRAGAAPGSAPPAALPAGPRPPQRLQRRLEEKPRALLRQPHRLGAHAGPLQLHAVPLLHRLPRRDDPAHRGPPQEPPARAPGGRDGFRGGAGPVPRQVAAGDGELPVLPALMPSAPKGLLHLP
uniref:Zinc finger protein 414 n=1 Tax=Geospiza parvula TaxID=87175 RepID=A0A8U8BAF7_GEOPR